MYKIKNIKLLDSRFNLFEKIISKVPNDFFDPQNNKLKIQDFFQNTLLKQESKKNQILVL